MNRNFHDALEDRDEKAQKKLAVLEDRITALGDHFEEEKVTILRHIEERGEELARMLKEFKVRLFLPPIVYVVVSCISYAFSGGV